MHVGSATVGARLRPLDGAVVRLRLAARPAAAGRRPGAAARPRQPAGAGRRRARRRPARAAPPRVPPGRARRSSPRGPTGTAGAAAELARRRIVRTDDFVAMGWPRARRTRPAHGPWLVAAGLRRRARRAGARRSSPGTGSCGRWSPGRRSRCSAGRWTCRTPTCCRRVVRPPFALRDGRVVDGAAALPAGGAARRRRRPGPAGRRPVRRAGGAATWSAAGLGAAGAGRGRAQRPAGPDRRRRLPGARRRRARRAARLAELPQPFTLSQARQAWGTSRRVAVPLMEWLDARGVTSASAGRHPPAALTGRRRGS